MWDAESFDRLDETFDHAVEQLVPGATIVTVLFSGGVDSALLAHAIARRREARLETVGVAGSSDLVAAESAASLLGVPWRGRIVDRESVRAALSRHALSDLPEPRRSVLASLAVAFESASPGSCVLGQGADELFGGYAHFRGLRGSELAERRTADWRRLLEVDWPATLDIAGRARVTVASPFLDPAFSQEVLRRPLTVVAPGEPTKPLLRAWARHRHVPEAIVDRPKRAMQYGTGIAPLVRKLSAR